MSFNYNFIEHTADIAFVIEADTIEELMEGSAYAFRDAAIELPLFEELENRKVSFDENSYEELLVILLDELNFLISTQQWVFYKIKIIKLNLPFMEVELTGHKIIDIEKYVKEEIKAVTYHQLEIKKINGKFTTKVVFDI